jgi:hypothetical protein
MIEAAKLSIPRMRNPIGGKDDFVATVAPFLY